MRDEEVQFVERRWLADLHDRTLEGVRPLHTPTGPHVRLLFTDGSAYKVAAKDGVHFDGAFVNTLRRAQPIVKVIITRESMYTEVVLRAEGFNLLYLAATNRSTDSHLFPFVLTKEVFHG